MKRGMLVVLAIAILIVWGNFSVAKAQEVGCQVIPKITRFQPLLLQAEVVGCKNTVEIHWTASGPGFNQTGSKSAPGHTTLWEGNWTFNDGDSLSLKVWGEGFASQSISATAHSENPVRVFMQEMYCGVRIVGMNDPSVQIFFNGWEKDSFEERETHWERSYAFPLELKEVTVRVVAYHKGTLRADFSQTFPNACWKPPTEPTPQHTPTDEPSETDTPNVPVPEEPKPTPPETWYPGAAQCEFNVGDDAQTYEIVWLAGNGSVGGVSQSGAVDNGKVTIVFANNGYYRLRSDNGFEVYFSMPGCVVPQPTPSPEDSHVVATPVPARQDLRIWQQGVVTTGTSGETTGLIEIPKLGNLQINLEITTTMALAVNNVVNQQIGYAACDANICGLHTPAYPGVMQGLQIGDTVIRDRNQYLVGEILEIAYEDAEAKIGHKHALIMCSVDALGRFTGNKVFILKPSMN